MGSESQTTTTTTTHTTTTTNVTTATTTTASSISSSSSEYGAVPVLLTMRMLMHGKVVSSQLIVVDNLIYS